MLTRNHTRAGESRRAYGDTHKTKPQPCMVAFADDLPDLFRWLETTPRVWSAASSEKNGRSDKWDLGAGWQGSLDMARAGWGEGALRLNKGLGALSIPSPEKAPRWRYDVAGHLPDVPRYLSGDPLNMRSRGKVKGVSPIVHIVLNNIVSGGTSADNIANFGLAIAGLVDLLEDAGRRVEIDVVMSNPMNGKGRGILGWKVKRASDPLDLSSVAFSIGHPAAFRRLGFAMIERTPADWEAYGYGRCEDLTPADLEDVGAPNAFAINGMLHNPGRCNTPADALAFAAEQVNAAAGEALIDLGDLPAANDTAPRAYGRKRRA